MIMLDTDILIWILRGKEIVYDQFKQLAVHTSGELFITPVQSAEIFAGVRENEKKSTEALLTALKLFKPGLREGILAGYYMKQYGKSHSVTLADALIAASVISEDLHLWTMNTKHYPMLDKKNLYIPRH